MTELEDELRRAFAEHVASVPVASPTLANDVLRRGRQLRRRRHQAAASGFAAFVLTTAGLIAITWPTTGGHPSAVAPADVPPVEPAASVTPSATPVPMSASASMPALALPFDLVAGNQLRTMSGRAVTMPNQGPFERAYRDPTGYLLVEASGPKRKLWHVPQNSGDPKLIIASADSIAVSEDGTRVAWTDGRDMSFRLLTDPLPAKPSGSPSTSASALPPSAAPQARAVATASPSGSPQPRLPSEVKTTAPEIGVPVGFVGDAVLLAAPGPADGRTRYDLWWPAHGSYHPTWREFLGVYGTRAGGREVVVVRQDDKNGICVSAVEPAALNVERSACGVVDVVPQYGSLSPDGRWLVVARDDRMQAVDLTTVFDHPAKREWQLSSQVQDLVWVGDATVAVPLFGRAVVYLYPMSGDVGSVRYALPGDPVVFVPQ
jgi:hypothetical protein